MSTRDTQAHEAPLPIGAVARELGVSVDTIREWERKGLVSSFRTPGNQRRFDPAEIHALKAPDEAGSSPSPGDGPEKAVA